MKLLRALAATAATAAFAVTLQAVPAQADTAVPCLVVLQYRTEIVGHAPSHLRLLTWERATSTCPGYAPTPWALVSLSPLPPLFPRPHRGGL